MPRPIRSDRPVSSRVHPVIYKAILGFAAVLILAMLSFARNRHSGLALAVAALFVAVALGLPMVLAHIAHRREPRLGRGDGTGLARWLAGDFDDFTGRIKGRDALVTLLLPIAAVSLGMLVFAIVLHVVVPGGA